jgi:chemotaxis-related protein WspD
MNEPIDDCWNRKGVHGDRSCELLAEHSHCHHCPVYDQAASRIMRRPLPADYRREWAAHFAQEEPAPKTNDRAALVFRIGAEWLALPARTALTVAEQSPAHRLPHRDGKVLTGIVNIRGRLYPCISLAGLLDIDSAPLQVSGPRAYPRLLAVQLQQQIFALPVDELHGIHRHAAADLQQPQAAANQALYRYVRNILRVEQRYVGCLDPELLGHKLASVLK